MLKGAWILPVIMLVVLVVAALVPAAASAADNRDPFRAPQTFFKDLPGVVPEESRVKPDAYRCTTEIADVYIHRGRRYDMLYGDTLPTRVYHCETESGITYTGTRMPNTQWVPGLNPHHLPE
jgi:hypothetical protein